MGKKKNKQQAAKEDAAPFNSAFAGLASLSGALPSAPKAEAPAPEPVPAEQVKKPGRVVLQREKKGRKGKTVTRVRGLDPDALGDWSKRLKKALGCGATVEGDDLILLGDVGAAAQEHLEREGFKVTRGN